ncbi:hypothetical protein [Methylomonas koyamae]|nr:hypothetical protein [Methylomonas koyamae]BBL60906.1 hypothetical protein MKFW12EY_45190 [Methylomonas koyamae]
MGLILVLSDAVNAVVPEDAMAGVENSGDEVDVIVERFTGE